MTGERLTEIESKLAFHEETLLVLNEVLLRQQQRIDQIEQMCMLLRKRWEDLQDRLPLTTSTFNPDADRPPHY